MAGIDDPVACVQADIAAVTSAFEAATAALLNLDDPATAFKLATVLWSELRADMDSNGRTRAILAAQVADAHPDLNLVEVATLLSTEHNKVRKARAGELIALGRKIQGQSPSVVSGGSVRADTPG
jgi:hypothetical protein